MAEEKRKNKATNSVNAVIAARNRFKATMLPSQRIAEIMRPTHSSIGHMLKLACPTLHITEMMRQINKQQHMFDTMTWSIRDFAFSNYGAAIKQAVSPLKFPNPVSTAVQNYQHTFGDFNPFRDIIEEQREAQKVIIDALRPAFEVQDSFALELSRMNSWQDTLRSITDSLDDFKPEVEVQKDTLIIEDEQFSQEYINQIAEEYIWDENSDKNVFREDGKKTSWDSIPKPVRWVINLIVATILASYIMAFWKETTKNTALNPERVAKQLIHFRKVEVRQINKSFQSETAPPFVNTEDLHVYTAPTKKCHAIAILSYPCDIKILKFRNKKRWALIEWTNESGEVQRGWVLGRYVYRRIK